MSGNQFVKELTRGALKSLKNWSRDLGADRERYSYLRGGSGGNSSGWSHEFLPELCPSMKALLSKFCGTSKAFAS